MNQQSPECQQIYRLNNKINLYIHIAITSCQDYTMYEMQHLVLVLYKEHSQTYISCYAT